jgi:hypothetical protein
MASFLQPCEGAGDLAHGDLHRIVGRRQVVAAGRHPPHSTADQGQNIGILGDQVARKPAVVVTIASALQGLFFLARPNCIGNLPD